MPKLRRASFLILLGILSFIMASILMSAFATAEVSPYKIRKVDNKEFYSYGEFVIPLLETNEHTYRPVKFDWSKTIHGKDREFYTEADKQKTYKLIRHVGKILGASNDGVKLLRLVSVREASLRGSLLPFDEMGLIHRLTADQESSYFTWSKPRIQNLYKDNPNINNPDIWKTYGLTGQNSALFLHRWDKNGDPRMLGDSVINLFNYMRAARAKWYAMQGKIRCWKWDEHGSTTSRWSKAKKKEVFLRIGVYARDENGNKIHEYVKVEPTWYTIHRAVSGGKLCPPWAKDQIAGFYKFMFEKRAKRIGLDSNAKVDIKDLGREPKNIDQYHLWKQTWESFLEEDINWSNYEG